MSEHDQRAVVLSAIDPRFDQSLMEIMRQGADQVPAYVPKLSHLSRDPNKLCRVLEFVLAHDSTILTTNYMLRARDVWVRRKHLLKPDDDNLLKGLEDMTGLSGAHQEAARQVAASLRSTD